MDKGARSKFKIVQARKRRLHDIGQSINLLFTKLKGEEMAKKNKSQTTTGFDDAYKKQLTPVPLQQSNHNHESAETEILIQNAAEIAKQNFTKNHKKPRNKKRKALIEEAMAMRKAKSHILEPLDQEQLRKLSIIAGRAFDKNAAE